MGHMETVTVSELNQQTARVLERIKAGETLEISEYGKPVARLVPAVPTTGVPLLDQLIAQGRAIPAAAPGPIPPTPPRDEQEDGVSLTDALAQMRADERY
jgi:prevent-host-death family protein